MEGSWEKRQQGRKRNQNFLSTPLQEADRNREDSTGSPVLDTEGNPVIEPAETAHARLHAAGTAGADFSREDKEIQAESVAFIVSAHYGLDTSEYSFPYVASWASGDETHLLTNLQVIKDASDEIIRSMDRSLERISLERQDQAIYKYPEGFLSLQRQDDGTWQYERFGTDYLPKISGTIPQTGLRIDQAAVKAAFQLGYTGAMQQTDPHDFLYRKEIAQIEQENHYSYRRK